MSSNTTQPNGWASNDKERDATLEAANEIFEDAREVVRNNGGDLRSIRIQVDPENLEAHFLCKYKTLEEAYRLVQGENYDRNLMDDPLTHDESVAREIVPSSIYNALLDNGFSFHTVELCGQYSPRPDVIFGHEKFAHMKWVGDSGWISRSSQ